MPSDVLNPSSERLTKLQALRVSNEFFDLQVATTWLGWDAALFLPGSADPFNSKAVSGGKAQSHNTTEQGEARGI